MRKNVLQNLYRALAGLCCFVLLLIIVPSVKSQDNEQKPNQQSSDKIGHVSVLRKESDDKGNVTLEDDLVYDLSAGTVSVVEVTYEPIYRKYTITIRDKKSFRN